MILVDTSVWVDYLRRTPGSARDAMRALFAGPHDHLVMCEPVACELLAGPTDESVVASIERLVNGLPTLGVEPDLDFRSSASIYRQARRSGRTVRSLNDCLIAAVALRHDATVLHKDADFNVIAEVTGLKVRSML